MSQEFSGNNTNNATNTTSVEAKSLEDKKSGLAFLSQVLSLKSNNSQSATSVLNGAGTTLSADDDPDKIAPFDLLSDAEKRSQFITELSTPGSSGSYATSNSYQQYGKVITYAISLSYAPLQPATTTTTTTAKLEAPQEQPEQGDKAKKWDPAANQHWAPNAWNGHSYYYPYYYIPGKPSFYFPPVDGHRK
ncbi:Hypothetical predicted protein [Cloeon dipterum]|uniref:Uncharacterized protein n=1 Tax=Cloeon dipterum TaxID=197152 RepID=A0A8S1D7U4_9INSE|nr:Hypothetical predicted protein [Cloeon dipterum]